MNFELQLVGVPVADVDRAKTFYTEQAGFVLDHDHTVSEEIRFVQLTPPGSACSIALGAGISDMAPGSLRGLPIVNLPGGHQQKRIPATERSSPAFAPLNDEPPFAAGLSPASDSRAR